MTCRCRAIGRKAHSKYNCGASRWADGRNKNRRWKGGPTLFDGVFPELLDGFGCAEFTGDGDEPESFFGGFRVVGKFECIEASACFFVAIRVEFGFVDNFFNACAGVHFGEGSIDGDVFVDVEGEEIGEGDGVSKTYRQAVIVKVFRLLFEQALNNCILYMLNGVCAVDETIKAIELESVQNFFKETVYVIGTYHIYRTACGTPDEDVLEYRCALFRCHGMEFFHAPFGEVEM